MRLAIVSVGAAIVAVTLYLATVWTRHGQLLGELMLGGRLASPTIVASAEQVLSAVSRTSVVIGTLAVIGAALVQRRAALAAATAVAIVGANVTTQVLKQMVLDRTDLLDGMFYPLPNSFPSGHVTAVASIAVGAILVLPPLLRAPWVLLAALVVGAIGASTLAAGWHRMADAVGGVFVATAWGAGAGAVLAWRSGVEIVGRRTAALGRLLSSAPTLAGLAIVGLGGLAYLLVALDPLDVVPVLAERGGSPALFGVGVGMVIGAALVALGSLGLATRDIRLGPRGERADQPAIAEPSTEQPAPTSDPP